MGEIKEKRANIALRRKQSTLKRSATAAAADDALIAVNLTTNYFFVRKYRQLLFYFNTELSFLDEILTILVTILMKFAIF